MLFSSPTFLFVFFPIAFGFTMLAPRSVKRFALFAFSIFFYAWGDLRGVSYLAVSILANFGFGLLFLRANEDRMRRIVLVSGIVLNLAGLAYCKYAAFGVRIMNALLSLQLPRPDIYLPLGISFFTFHAISYIVDVYRKKREPETSIVNFGVYMAFFPQLLAGPILRYEAYALQNRSSLDRPTLDDLEFGFRRFIQGLAKKTLLADPLSAISDATFALSPLSLTPGAAWIGLLSYGLQIYFDFSGYSDMAIGLGRMFGYRLPENFRSPYAAASVTDFWRRWHRSLLDWLREYVYLPLGGSRGTALRTALNVMVVFTLSGLWHGAGWHFVFWGMYFGMILVAERMLLQSMLNRMPKIFRHGYTILLVMIGWVFFRSPTLAYAFSFLQTLFGLHAVSVTQVPEEIRFGVLQCLALGAVMIEALVLASERPATFTRSIFSCLSTLALLILNLGAVAVTTYNPFLYFQF